jgi:hypothetical protein
MTGEAGSFAFKGERFVHHWAGFDPDTITRPDFKHRLYSFKKDAGAVLHRSAILVGSPVGCLVQELQGCPLSPENTSLERPVAGRA